MKEILLYIFELKFLLPKETLNLEKINKLGYKLNKLMYNKKYSKYELLEIKLDFQEIKTKEHKEKIDFFIIIINDLL